jgi:type I restriction enzyme M protein
MKSQAAFYTPSKIADILIRQINYNTIETAIDICCGSCNLLYAAKKRWPIAKLTGVDIVPHNSRGIKCICSDGREYALNQRGKYPLVLANPPFALLNKKGEFSELYNGEYSKYSTSRLEIEMLLANLRLLNNDGLLVIILPNTFVESERNGKLRSILAQSYHVQKIIHLPNDTFGSAGIKSYALFISKKIKSHCFTKYHEITSLKNVLNITKGIIIEQHNIRAGQWLSQEDTKIPKEINIQRGKTSSQMFIDDGIPILHTSKANDNWVPSVRYIEREPENSVCIENGDIVVSRIGKSAGLWTVYNGEKKIISDCLYCLKDPLGDIHKKIKGRKYDSIIRGVVTQYITQKDFISWIYQS